MHQNTTNRELPTEDLTRFQEFVIGKVELVDDFEVEKFLYGRWELTY